MTLLPFEDARARLLSDVHPVAATERVSILRATGRVLAGDVGALRTQPSFDASAMDGYAVRAEDVADCPIDLVLIGESAAGRAFEGALRTGQAVRIFTGAPIPAGADAVVIQENTTGIDQDRVRILQSILHGGHVRLAGNDFSAGAVLATKGARLGAGSAALIASGGHAEVEIVRRPRVAVAATGDELVPPGTLPGPSQIIACNGIALAGIIEAAGGEVLDLGIVRDKDEELVRCLARAEAEGADVLVTIGGASVGDYDLVGPVMRREGVSLDFWKVAMRPGKPLMAGRKGDMRVLGLPGNPASCLVTAELFLKPLVERLAGRPAQRLERKGFLGTAVKANDHRTDFLRATVHYDADTHGTIVTPLPRQDSSLLSVFAQADALLIRPAHAPAAVAGEECLFIPLTT
ncbi:gephyrin-like molybdotransferase Glp [Aureimonas sp. ME7]|uniref:molybdopterin molybdotransferase MoeA n=1 Tax=Aureimonas sp. ME7 TaxID=2744252 RepID=UPI0015F746CF|nr:gephyrin-like molybdotransferase Glp [Aureimonas sp. ME7]